MGAATRVEESIGSAERVRFDLVPVLGSAVAAYRPAFPERSSASSAHGQPLMLTGAPDLIVQMLDKLIDNAVDFSPGRLRSSPCGCASEAAAALIEVDNPGPALPLHLEGRVFESLWQSRPGSDSRPHLGLGLYIVRLIAEFHGGEATAANLADGGGVRLSRAPAR